MCAASYAREIKVEPKKVDEPAHEVIDRELLQLLDRYQVLITTFAADRLGLSRQKALWHFHRLRDAGRCTMRPQCVLAPDTSYGLQAHPAQ